MARTSKPKNESYGELDHAVAILADVLRLDTNLAAGLRERFRKGLEQIDVSHRAPLGGGPSPSRQPNSSEQSIEALFPARASAYSHADAVIERAIEVIGNREKALQWLGTPVRALGYATPISKLSDEAGAREVLAVLDQLEQGVW
jgi:Protein of unknown function (DUF2384)